MEPLVYYISGPMTGLPDFNYPFFNAVASQLRGQGLKILSPSEVDAGIQLKDDQEPKPYSYWLKKAMRMMCEADAIIMLEGWTRSKGARAELDFMLDCGLPAYRLDITSRYLDTVAGKDEVHELVLVELDAGIEHPNP